MSDKNIIVSKVGPEEMIGDGLDDPEDINDETGIIELKYEQKI